MHVVLGSFLDLESVYCIKSFFNNIGCSNINYQSNINFPFDFRFTFLLNATINGLELISMCFFIGLNIRLEAPLLNYRLRKNFLKNNNFLPSFSIGLSLDYLTFPVLNFGNSSKLFYFILQGKYFFLKNILIRDFYNFKYLNYKFIQFDRFSIFLGTSCLSRFDGRFFLDYSSLFLINYYSSSIFWRGSLNLVSNFLGRLSCFELGALPGINHKIINISENINSSFFYICGVDQFVNLNDSNFYVFQGSFQSNFIKNFNIIFPVTLYVERISFFINIEGRLRKSQKIISAFKYVINDLDIIKSLVFFKSFYFHSNFSLMLNFNSLISFFFNLIDYSCSFFKFLAFITEIKLLKIDLFAPFILNFLSLDLYSFCLNNSLFARSINNYYMTDQFTNNSKIMSICFFKTSYSSFSSYFLDKYHSL